jgi:hypothetical protein
MSFLLCAVLAVSTGVGRSEVVAPVPGTVLHVAFEAPGFRDQPEIRAKLLEEAGQSGVIAGAIDPSRSTLSVIFVKDEPRRTSAQWRDEFARRAKEREAGARPEAPRDNGARGRPNNRGAQGNPAEAKPESTKREPFQVGAVACSELVTTQADQQVNTRYDAYFVSAGIVLDLHVSTWSDPQADGLSRRDFQKIVESFQVVFVRHGTPGDLPRDAREAMHESLAAWPEWRRPLAARLARKPDDANLQFVQAELLLLSDAPQEEVVEAHGKVLASLQKLRSTTAEQRFEWMLCEQSVGLSLLRAEDAAGAIPHLDKCVEIARQLRSRARPIALYSLACAQARGGDPVVAIRCLDEAFGAEPKLRDAARKEPAFQSLAGDKRYQALVHR